MKFHEFPYCHLWIIYHHIPLWVKIKQKSSQFKFKVTYVSVFFPIIYLYVLELKIIQNIPSYALFCFVLFFLWLCGPTRPMASLFLGFLDQTERRITVGRTPLDEWSACRRDLYLIITLNTDIHASGGIRTHNPSKRAAVDPCLRSRGHRDRLLRYIYVS
jgi:hypothetical protein